MKQFIKLTGLMLILCLLCGLAAGAGASVFTDAHGNEIELDESLEAWSEVRLLGADERLRACFDTNHLLIEDFSTYLDRVKDKIVTLHVSDCI